MTVDVVIEVPDVVVMGTDDVVVLVGSVYNVVVIDVTI